MGRAALLLAVLLGHGCGKSDPKSPGIDSMGAPGIAWSQKNEEQRFGFMAAQVTPKMKALFTKHDATFAKDFGCDTCHGENPELIDYEMPAPTLYALPRENTIEESLEYDAEMTAFMQKELTPAMLTLFNQGEGPDSKMPCFACHPYDE